MRRGVSSTWINTEERASASTFCYEQYSRAADTRRTLLHRVGPSCKGPRVDTGTPSLHADVVLRRPRLAGGCDSPVDRERRILRSRARRALPVPACSMHFSFIFIPWIQSGETQRERHSWICSLACEKICVRIHFLSPAASFDINIVLLFHLFAFPIRIYSVLKNKFLV